MHAGPCIACRASNALWGALRGGRGPHAKQPHPQGRKARRAVKQPVEQWNRCHSDELAGSNYKPKDGTMNFTKQHQSLLKPQESFLLPTEGVTMTGFADRWIADNLDLTAAAVTKLSGRDGIYNLYRADCREVYGHTPISRIAFSKKIEDFAKMRTRAFLKNRVRGGVIFEGVGLTQEAIQRRAGYVPTGVLEEERRPHKIKEKAGLREEASQENMSQAKELQPASR